jgi:hypothetical protein
LAGPPGKSIKYDEIFILRFINGRVAESWLAADVLSQLRQLGATRQKLVTEGVMDRSRQHDT